MSDRITSSTCRRKNASGSGRSTVNDLKKAAFPAALFYCMKKMSVPLWFVQRTLGYDVPRVFHDG